MLTETFHSITTATRKVFANWRAMLLLAIVYASLLAALYFFLAVREASIAQVVLTFALAILAPLLFFVLQAMVASTDEATVGSLLGRSLASFWKLVLISLPLIALGILIAYLLSKAQTHWNIGVSNPDAEVSHRLASSASAQRAAKPIDWKLAMLSTVRYLVFGLLLPLAAIHLWLATAREGLLAALRRVITHLARAFAPRSVLIYIAGFLIFGVVPYFLLFKTTSTKHAWLELSLLVARLLAVFALTLFGWVITVRALGQTSGETSINGQTSTNSPTDVANEAA